MNWQRNGYIKPEWKNEHEDAYGNRLITLTLKKVILVNLLLTSNGSYREIGKINRKKREFVAVRIRTEHTLRKTDSYGFHAELIRGGIKGGILFDTIRLTDDLGEYVFPRKALEADNDSKQFSRAGFEEQLFISLEKLETYRIKKRRQKNPAQAESSL